ncbi:MAG: aldehyde dehydrogenase family protein [Candidatus Aminicenantales bacterium]
MSSDQNPRPRTVSINPATGEIIGHHPEDRVDDLADLLKKARAAQKAWAATSFKERARRVLSVRDAIVVQADRIAEIISRDNGKTRLDALSTEVLPAAMAVTYYAKKAAKFLKPRKIGPGNILFINKKSHLEHVPYGVIGIISPWNYPFAIPFHEIAMALMAGNAVLLKVATPTQQVAILIREIVAAGTLPEGLFHLVNIPGNLAGQAFIDAGVDKIFFTGSVAVGKKLMAAAAPRLLPLSLELGGNDPMIVCRDANLHRAAAGAAWAGYSNAGQSCGGVERIYVEKEVYPEFIALLGKITESLTYGADADGSVDVGAITTKAQLQTIQEHLDDALAKGAKNTFYSKRLKGNSGGFFFPPTVLESVDDSMMTMRLETFGPIVAVAKVENIDEAIEKANRSNLGLTASVWTRNRKKARRIASRLEAGTVSINDHLMSHGLAETPWGGFKESGLGRTHGSIGLEEMTQTRVVVDDALPFVQKNMWWYPHSRSIYDGLMGGLHFLYGKKWTVRFKGLRKLLPVFMRTFRKTP